MSTRRAHVLLIATLLLAGFPTAAGALETFDRTFAVDGRVAAGGLLEIENLLGSIRIRAGSDSREVRIEAQVIAEAKTREEAQALAEAIEIERSFGGQRASFHVSFPFEMADSFRLPKSGVKGLLARWAAPVIGRELSVDYAGRTVRIAPDRKSTGLAVHLNVILPLDARSAITQSVGTIETRGIRGTMELTMVDGDLLVEQFFGKLAVNSDRGTARVVSFQGDELDVETRSGTIELVRVRSERTQLRTENGAIRGGALTTEKLIIESGSGEVKLEGVEPTLAEVTTETGKVDLATRLTRTREAVIRSASGDVTLRVGQRAGFDLVAESKSGEVKTLGVDLDVVESAPGLSKLRRGHGGAELRVSTVRGGVTVRPFDASRLQILVGNIGP